MAALAITASLANAGVVDPANSSAVMANSPAILTIAPGGYDGLVFPVNHLIDVYVNDSANNPVEILAVDIWIEDPYVIWCPGGVIADSSTYAPDPGHTTFSSVVRGGVAGTNGTSCEGDYIDVIALGQVIENLDLRANSMDLNGNGSVTLADFTLFAGVYQTRNFCANYNESTEVPPNANVTLADFTIFASVYNLSTCP